MAMEGLEVMATWEERLLQTKAQDQDLITKFDQMMAVNARMEKMLELELLRRGCTLAAPPPDPPPIFYPAQYSYCTPSVRGNAMQPLSNPIGYPSMYGQYGSCGQFGGKTGVFVGDKRNAHTYMFTTAQPCQQHTYVSLVDLHDFSGAGQVGQSCKALAEKSSTKLMESVPSLNILTQKYGEEAIPEVFTGKPDSLSVPIQLETAHDETENARVIEVSTCLGQVPENVKDSEEAIEKVTITNSIHSRESDDTKGSKDLDDSSSIVPSSVDNKVYDAVPLENSYDNPTVVLKQLVADRTASIEQLVAADAKLNFDDNAAYHQKDDVLSGKVAVKTTELVGAHTTTVKTQREGCMVTMKDGKFLLILEIGSSIIRDAYCTSNDVDMMGILAVNEQAYEAVKHKIKEKSYEVLGQEFKLHDSRYCLLDKLEGYGKSIQPSEVETYSIQVKEATGLFHTTWKSIINAEVYQELNKVCKASNIQLHLMASEGSTNFLVRRTFDPGIYYTLCSRTKHDFIQMLIASGLKGSVMADDFDDGLDPEKIREGNSVTQQTPPNVSREIHYFLKKSPFVDEEILNSLVMKNMSFDPGIRGRIMLVCAISFFMESYLELKMQLHVSKVSPAVAQHLEHLCCFKQVKVKCVMIVWDPGGVYWGEAALLC